MSGIELIQGEFDQKFTLVYNDGSRIKVKARSYFISDRGYYCFCKETFNEMTRLVMAGKFTSTVYEVHRREVFCVFDSAYVEVEDKPVARNKSQRVGQKAKPVTKPRTTKEKRVRK